VNFPYFFAIKGKGGEKKKGREESRECVCSLSLIPFEEGKGKGEKEKRAN